MTPRLQKISVFKEIIFTFKNWKALGKIVLLPLLLIGTIELLGDPTVEFNEDGGLRLHYSFLNIMLYVLSLFMHIIWVPQWIRYVANPQGCVCWFRIDKATVKFFLYKLVISYSWIVFVVIVIGDLWGFYKGMHLELSDAIKQSFALGVIFCLLVGLPFVLIAFFTVFFKSHFIFPAVALGHKTGFAISWRQTKGQVWRIAGMHFKGWLYCLLFMGIAIVLYMLLYGLLHVAFFPFLSGESKQIIKQMFIGKDAVIVIQQLIYLLSMISFFMGAVIIASITRLYQQVVKQPSLN